VLVVFVICSFNNLVPDLLDTGNLSISTKVIYLVFVPEEFEAKLFKNTSVVGFIAIQDLTKASEIIRARTFDAFFPLIIISILYFTLAWLFGKLLDKLGNKLA